MDGKNEGQTCNSNDDELIFANVVRIIGKVLIIHSIVIVAILGEETMSEL